MTTATAPHTQTGNASDPEPVSVQDETAQDACASIAITGISNFGWGQPAQHSGKVCCGIPLRVHGVVPQPQVVGRTFRQRD